LITRVYDDQVDYEVGKDGVVSIEPSNQGSENVTMYMITHSNGENLFLGLKKHKIIVDNETITID